MNSVNHYPKFQVKFDRIVISVHFNIHTDNLNNPDTKQLTELQVIWILTASNKASPNIGRL